jgi:uncharacterized protein
MSSDASPRKFKLHVMAQEAREHAGLADVAQLPRLRADLDLSGPPVQPIAWQAMAQWRERAGGEPELWLHLRANAQLPLTCQRCLTPVVQTLAVDRWFRFVESEDVAQAQDDDCEEDLLVFEPQFDLLSLLEDELLMELPLVPMHETCPDLPALGQESPLADPSGERPHPFAALASLKGKGR